MSHCSSACSQPSQGASTGARLLQMLRADRASEGCHKGSPGRAAPPPAPPPPPPPPTPPSCGNGADAKSLFDVLSVGDADGNGTLSSCEIGKTAAAGLMSDIFGKIDSDGDGQLNEGEVGAYESAVDEVLKVMGSEAGIAEIVAKAGEKPAEAPPGEDHGDDHGHHHGPDRAEGPRGGHHRHGHHGHDHGGIRMDEATATVVADALIGVLESMDGNGDGTLTACELDKATGPGTCAEDTATAPAGAAAAPEAAPVSEAPAEAAIEEADTGDTTDTGGAAGGGASPNALSAAIFAALARQVGESDDTTQLAHQYTRVLHTLKG